MLKSPALPSWKLSSPWQITRWKVPQTYPPTYLPLLNPSPNLKIPLKTSVHFPITITVCKHWSKFVTCSPSHGNCGGISGPQRHSYEVFFTTLSKMAISEFWSVYFGKIISVEGGLGALQFFWSPKRALELFHFR